MADWAADCADRVLPLFERIYPEDDRPCRAIDVCRVWAQGGVLQMAEIRAASLAAHVAARDAARGSAAQFAARAAGQAVATAHVPQHAYGAAWYALKAIAAADPADAMSNVTREREWQTRGLPEGLREEIMGKIVVLERGDGVAIKLRKGENF